MAELRDILDSDTLKYIERIAQTNPLWFQWLQDACRGDARLVKEVIASSTRNLQSTVGSSTEGINPFQIMKANSLGLLKNQARDDAAELSFEIYRCSVAERIKDNFGVPGGKRGLRF